MNVNESRISLASRIDCNSALLCIAVSVLAMLPYLQTFGHEFITLDDGVFVFQNPYVMNGMSWDGFLYSLGLQPPDIKFPHLGHPLAWWSHMLDVQMFGLNPCGHHVVNVLLHAANVALLFVFLSRLTGSSVSAAICATIFAVHPAHVQVVAWVAQRKTLLCGVFQLLCLISYLRYAERPNIRRYVIVTVFFSMALLSKASAVTLPCVFLLLDFWPLQRSRAFKSFGCDVSGSVCSTRSLVSLLIEKLPWFAMTAGISLFAYMSQEQAGAVLGHPSVSDRLVKSMDAYCVYILKSTIPDLTGVLHPAPIAPSGWKIAAEALTLITITLLALWRVKKQPSILVGWCWFIGTLVPVVGVVQLASQLYATRYLYLTMPGLLVALSSDRSLQFQSTQSTARRIATIGSLALVLTGYLALTTYEASKWRDSITLFSYAIEVEGLDRQTGTLLAMKLSEEQRWEESVEYFREVIGIDGEYGRVFYGLYRDALEQLLKSEPNRSREWNDLGVVHCLLSDFQKAIPCFEQAVQLDPDLTQAVLNAEHARIELEKSSQATDTSSSLTGHEKGE
ncbi:MAG: tetratricopeptide repeat protein [Planctomycetota bacterium]|nr:tetratricopeptide repeat protein [Planctomycetota bacterium]